MSKARTDSSGSPSPASSVSSPRAAYSDTTPSPSGGNKSPPLNPHDLTGRLALIEASESLAEAAETLSLAAKAMSKAAASLAAAGRYQDWRHDKGSYRYELNPEDMQAHYDGVESPVWQQNSYELLSPRHASTSGKNNFGNNQLSQTTLHEHAVPKLLDPVDSTASIPSDITPAEITPSPSSYELHNLELPTPTAESEDQTTESSILANTGGEPDVTVAGQSNSIISERPPEEPGVQQHSEWWFGDSGSASANSSADIWGPGGDVGIVPATGYNYQAIAGTPSPRWQRVILSSGFDQLPLICELAKQHPKIICFCKYWGGAPSVMSSILNKIIPQPVNFPLGAKPGALQSAVAKFISRPSAILIWPAQKALPSGSRLHTVHMIHLGEPMKETAGYSGSGATLIITQKELNEMHATNRDKLNKQYPMDRDNHTYNQEGPGSKLQTARAGVRARLSKVSSARGLYLGWIDFQRSQHPHWTAVELIRRANDYAEEYLLHGVARNRNLVGGRIPLTSSEVKSMKLQPAVQAGILSVS